MLNLARKMWKIWEICPIIRCSPFDMGRYGEIWGDIERYGDRRVAGAIQRYKDTKIKNLKD